MIHPAATTASAAVRRSFSGGRRKSPAGCFLRTSPEKTKTSKKTSLVSLDVNILCGFNSRLNFTLYSALICAAPCHYWMIGQVRHPWRGYAAFCSHTPRLFGMARVCRFLLTYPALIRNGAGMPLSAAKKEAFSDGECLFAT